MKSALRWGIVVGGLSLLWHVLEKLTGFDSDFIEFHRQAGLMFFIPYGLIYILALLQLKRENGGRLSYIDGVKHALFISIMSIPFVLLAVYIKINWLSPDFQTDMIDYLITTGADIDTTKKAYSDSGLLLNTPLYCMSGVVVGAIAMLFIKKD